MSHTVLLVDDDEELLELFRHMLRREAVAVETARNALGACDVLAARRVAVVVADEGLPGMTGTELLARVHAEHPETVRVMVTGQASMEVAKRAINEGKVFRFLTKPVRTDDLVGTVRDGIAIWQARRLPPRSAPAAPALSEIDRLESEWQGLTHVERDSSGAILVDETDGDLDEVLREVSAPIATVVRARRGAP